MPKRLLDLSEFSGIAPIRPQREEEANRDPEQSSVIDAYVNGSVLKPS